MIFPASISAPFVPDASSLAPFAGELVLVGAMISVLLAAFFTKGRPNGATAIVTLVGLVVALGAMVFVHGGSVVTGFFFHGMLVSDALAVAWKGMLFLFVIGLVLMWVGTTGPSMREGDGPEFFTLLLGATLGMALMGSTTNLLMIFMAVELASFPSYVLAGFRKHNKLGAEASLKYVLFGAASAAVMVYGLSFLYGLYGTLQLEELAAMVGTQTASGVLLAVALVGFGVGIAFKIAAVPFHFWAPDVFEGSAVDVAAFLSVASKGAAVVLLLRFLMTLAHGVDYAASSPALSMGAVAVVVGVVGALTATLGNTAALWQENLKRILAYSSIAHAGYMVCALTLVVRNGAGELDTTAAAQSIVVYLAVYLFMNLGAFAVAGLVWRETGSETVAGLAGLGRRAPLMALSMTVCLISLIGLPPVAGFFAKLNIMVHLGRQGGWWWALVGAIALNTLLSIYYYVRIIRVMYFAATPGDAQPLRVSPIGATVAVLSAVKLVIMFVAFGPFDRLAGRWSTMLLEAPVARVSDAREMQTPP